ncbi:MAG: recombinase family protein [Methanosarcina thermophila]
MNKEKNRAAIYSRSLSHEDHFAERSTAEQIQECIKFALVEGIVIVQDQVYEERVDEKSTELPVLEMLLNAAREGKFDVLLLSKYASLARKPSVSVDILRLFAEMGVEVVSVSEPESLVDNIASEIADQFRRELIQSRMAVNSGSK